MVREIVWFIDIRLFGVGGEGAGVGIAGGGGHGDGRFVELADVDVSGQRGGVECVGLEGAAEVFGDGCLAYALGQHESERKIRAVILAGDNLTRRRLRTESGVHALLL